MTGGSGGAAPPREGRAPAEMRPAAASVSLQALEAPQRAPAAPARVYPERLARAQTATHQRHRCPPRRRARPAARLAHCDAPAPRARAAASPCRARRRRPQSFSPPRPANRPARPGAPRLRTYRTGALTPRARGRGATGELGVGVFPLLASVQAGALWQRARAHHSHARRGLQRAARAVSLCPGGAPTRREDDGRGGARSCPSPPAHRRGREPARATRAASTGAARCCGQGEQWER